MPDCQTPMREIEDDVYFHVVRLPDEGVKNTRISKPHSTPESAEKLAMKWAKKYHNRKYAVVAMDSQWRHMPESLEVVRYD